MWNDCYLLYLWLVSTFVKQKSLFLEWNLFLFFILSILWGEINIVYTPPPHLINNKFFLSYFIKMGTNNCKQSLNPNLSLKKCFIPGEKNKLDSTLGQPLISLNTFWSSPSELDIGSWCQPSTHPPNSTHPPHSTHHPQTFQAGSLKQPILYFYIVIFCSSCDAI